MRGQNVCFHHGGAASQNRQAAARRLAEQGTKEVSRRHAEPRPITPLSALEEELARCQGWIDFLGERIRNRPDDSATAIWVNVYQAERAQLASLAHKMIGARTDERRTVLAEQAVERLEAAIGGILKELGRDPNDPHVRAVVGRHLRAVGEPRSRTSLDDDAEDAEDPPNVRPLPIKF